MRYQFIQEQQEQFSLAALCRVMEVCRGAYYAWRKRGPSARQQHNDALTEQIRTVYHASKATYGSPRIFAELHEGGIACSEKRIARLMQQHQLSALRPKRFVITTASAHALPVADNLLDRVFTADAPNTRWTADFTYLWMILTTRIGPFRYSFLAHFDMRDWPIYGGKSKRLRKPPFCEISPLRTA